MLGRVVPSIPSICRRHKLLPRALFGLAGRLAWLKLDQATSKTDETHRWSMLKGHMSLARYFRSAVTCHRFGRGDLTPLLEARFTLQRLRQVAAC